MSDGRTLRRIRNEVEKKLMEIDRLEVPKEDVEELKKFLDKMLFNLSVNKWVHPGGGDEEEERELKNKIPNAYYYLVSEAALKLKERGELEDRYVKKLRKLKLLKVYKSISIVPLMVFWIFTVLALLWTIVIFLD